MPTKDELIAERNRIANALYRIEERERGEANKALLGKCFRYRNSYGGSTERERWWMYAKIIGLRAGRPIMFRFQVTTLNELQIEPGFQAYSEPHSSGYHPIPASEFNRAWRAIQKRIASLRP